jgi:uncharacterized repeat protein (TIGR03803 family)
MKIPRFADYPLGLCVVAAGMLADCGGSQPPIGAAGVMPHSAQTRLAPLAAASYKSLYSFQGETNGAMDGAFPATNLIGVKGMLYGTTPSGGAGCSPTFNGCGTVFAISTSGAERVLYRFGGEPDGAYPYARLIDVNGTFYGTTGLGGASNNGTVFTITTSGAENVLYSFKGKPDGAGPADLTDVKGTLYGITSQGGNGTVFKITTSGKEAVIYSFGSGSYYDGRQPVGRLIDVKGTLYGTTRLGGSHCEGASSNGCGTVFKVTTSGKEKVIYSFKGKVKGDGELPDAGLTEVNGALYGVTSIGGSSKGLCGDGKAGCGIVFEVTTSGVEKIIHRFVTQPDGLIPKAPLTAVNGTLYGTTYYGGSGKCGGYGCGAVFKITPSGTESVLYSFNGNPDGEYPVGGLTDVNGTLYGTTTTGGTACESNGSGCGTVFRISP